MKPFIFIAVLGFFVGCSEPQSVTVSWPELKTVDHEVEELEAMLAGETDPAAVSSHLKELVESIQIFVASEVPAGAHNPKLVDQKLVELSALNQSIQENNYAADPEILQALHPLVVAIMHEAGMPHVHEEDHGHHHHDGEDHDHGHDHGEEPHAHDH
ncbi:hypothetical protein P0Y35_10815 [Kiritimatiellaeota bacterium B1221]|nr:hypothetical protein [Kiritimatiellaeota bacterium B1221]